MGCDRGGGFKCCAGWCGSGLGGGMRGWRVWEGVKEAEKEGVGCVGGSTEGGWDVLSDSKAAARKSSS